MNRWQAALFFVVAVNVLVPLAWSWLCRNRPPEPERVEQSNVVVLRRAS